MSRVEELGERKIIELLIQKYRKSTRALPFGDDVAAIPINNRLSAVLKTDVLTKKTDVPPTMTLHQAARKAVVMNISDFAAKGVKPLAILTSLTIPKNYSKTDIEEIGEGLNCGAEEYDTYIIGGDTSEGLELTICCMVFGMTKTNRLIKRSGAQPGDLVAVTGLFGKTTAGLRILIEDLRVPSKIGNTLTESVKMPKAKLREGVALAHSNTITSSIDSSDGLAICLHELSKHSGLGMEITQLPIAPEVNTFAKIYGLNPEDLALYGGEEYELVLTVHPRRWRLAQKTVQEVGGQLIAIGKTMLTNEIILSKGEDRKKIDFRGWEHFKKYGN